MYIFASSTNQNRKHSSPLFLQGACYYKPGYLRWMSPVPFNKITMISKAKMMLIAR